MKISKPNHSTHPPRQPVAARRVNDQKISTSTNTGIEVGFITSALTGLRRHLHTRRGISILSALLIIITLSIVIGLASRQPSSKNEARTPSSVAVENLEYQTVLPDDKAIGNLGGWRQISPPGAEPVYAYVDTISNTTINVSQQPLPDSFKDDVDSQIANMAKKFNATTKIDADDTKAYIGTSAKGPQSVIFTKNGLLILIKSQQTITDKSWIDYIQSLK